MEGPQRGRKVGELAAASGLTVRTLHYYEELGLLEPSGRTQSGHRVYGAAEVERLYRNRPPTIMGTACGPYHPRSGFANTDLAGLFDLLAENSRSQEAVRVESGG